MHALKTGALIRAACEAGALIGGASAAQMQKLSDYGAHLGRAFQIPDDVLDVEGDPHLTGKSATDAINDKLTAPAVFGLAEAKRLAVDASEAAVAALKEFGERAATLRQLAALSCNERSNGSFAMLLSFDECFCNLNNLRGFVNRTHTTCIGHHGTTRTHQRTGRLAAAQHEPIARSRRRIAALHHRYHLSDRRPLRRAARLPWKSAWRCTTCSIRPKTRSCWTSAIRPTRTRF